MRVNRHPSRHLNDDIAVFLEEIGTDVRHIREGRGWSKREAARETGVSFHVLDALERGHGSTLITLYRLAEAYGYDIFVDLEPA